jgi:hypothetical protein
MRKLTIVLTAMVAMLFAGLLAWKAEATTMAGAVAIGAHAHSYSPIVKEAACFGWGRHCPPGTHWVCGPVRGCWCAPC